MGKRDIAALERRLKEIDREKARLRERMSAVARAADSVAAELPAPGGTRGPRLRAGVRPTSAHSTATEPYGGVLGGVGVLEVVAEDPPMPGPSLEFEPGPEGLDTKHVVMPRLERTDLLRPSYGGAATAGRRDMRVPAPEYDRFRNYFGTTGLKRVREARKAQGNHRVRAVFMIGMVLVLSFILFKMMT